MEIVLHEALFGLGLRQHEQPSQKSQEEPQEKKYIIIVPDQFKDDVEKLKSYVGEENWKPGLEIKLGLKELLSICPHERRRSDSFRKLIGYLDEELKINLIIKKQEGKK